MIVLLSFAFLSGIVTILSPCILPVLPIVLSGSVGGKTRPFGVVAGFVISFSVFTLALSGLVQALGIQPDSLRVAAVVLITLFGLVMVIPQLRRGFEHIASRISGRNLNRAPSRGFSGGLIVGFSLGLVWTPCVGPIIASVISLAITQRVDGGAVFIILAYSLGTSLPMLAVMFGGRSLLKRVPGLAKNSSGIQRVFGVLMILVGIAIGFGWDRQFQTAVLRVFPNYGSGLTAFESIDPVRKAIDARAVGEIPAMMAGSNVASFDVLPKNGKLGDYGPAPQIVTDGEWFNAEEPISMDDLRGKVVLVDFWTYSCVNCVRTLPHLRSWYDAYKDDGLVIVGVHTPEFAFERSPANVQKAIADLGVTWPVVLDNDFAQWQAYNNRYWPAHYFIDAEGIVRYFSYGEGHYDTSEKVIRRLLKEAGGAPTEKAAERVEADLESRTPEVYLGYGRSEGFSSGTDLVQDRSVAYRSAETLDNGEWSLDGTWIVRKEHVLATETGVLELAFHAKDVFLVIEPAGGEGRIEVRADGAVAADTPDVRDGVVRPSESRLYQLLSLPEPGEHVLNLKVYGRLKLFAFTFG
jgi:cytochrome c biogenesis protein CcdA/thiol-disulfide isomerase/thioredoxin